MAGTFGSGNGVPLLQAASFTAAGLQDYDSSANAKRVQQGIGEALRNGNLHGKPALIVHDRADTLVPVAFSSRPYFGVNRMVEGNTSKLSYIEIENGQHFDAFLGFPGFANRFIPVHRYFVQAMDMMYANLKSGAALPPS